MIMSQKRTRVGDVLEIPLSNGRKAYGQYVYKDETMGPLVQVFDLITSDDLDPEQILELLKKAHPLFPPVLTGLFAAIRTGLWKAIGHMPIKEFVYPGFVSVYHEQYQTRGPWSLWDGKKRVNLGPRLPEQYKSLEFLVGWDPHDVAHRIETGENPYEKMIREG